MCVCVCVCLLREEVEIKKTRSSEVTIFSPLFLFFSLIILRNERRSNSSGSRISTFEFNQDFSHLLFFVCLPITVYPSFLQSVL